MGASYSEQRDREGGPAARRQWPRGVRKRLQEGRRPWECLPGADPKGILGSEDRLCREGARQGNCEGEGTMAMSPGSSFKGSSDFQEPLPREGQEAEASVFCVASETRREPGAGESRSRTWLTPGKDRLKT